MTPTRQPHATLANILGLRKQPARQRFRSWELHITKPGEGGEPSESYIESNTRKIDAEASKARLERDGYTVIGPTGSTRRC